ncbi:hypothetical protein [Streptomyces sp. ML-6]|uniref:hypothetical protein n=1 Tax=Streptomyces sp. ML-6 TaxID=2982693 RepID=UPI0024BF37A4|nr:hypothetical protein [Streptomyces sp. ML-6]MDK0518222.1 hypothetical protein [Streptomyces sp. ML-6]
MGLVAGLAATSLTGCVSVQPRPDAPARPDTGGPAQDLAPQTARPPVHDSLEAVPASESPASPSPRAAPPDTRRAAPGAPRRPRLPHVARPRPRQAPPAVIPPAPPLPAPVAGTDVCALGRSYGHWPAGSPQSRICEHTYGR